MPTVSRVFRHFRPKVLRRKGAPGGDLLGYKVAYGGEALRLARTTSSGYVAHELQGLRTDLDPLIHDARVAEPGAEIDALCTT
jgi:hypothetical protein